MNVFKNINIASKTLGFKIFIILVLGLLFLIPMQFISYLVKDRKNYQGEAISSIINPIGGVLKLEGIVMAIPYERYSVVSNVRVLKREYIITMPDKYSVEGDVDITTLNRGIFKAPIFNSVLKASGDFSAYNSSLNYIDPSYILWDDAVLIVGVGSKKNFTKLPTIYIDKKEIKTYDKNINIPIDFFDNMLFFKISRENALNGFKFLADINVQGGDSIEITPMTSENTFKISSKWSAPSFSGDWLPTKREVTKNGFTAEWNIPSFNVEFNKSWNTEGNNFLNSSFSSSSFSKYSYSSTSEKYKTDNVVASFLLLNDNYQKTSRSLKYQLLFIFIPFLALFLCEILTKKKIHPVQYILIGLANAVFYLLLLSISEHLTFNLSYLISALLVTSLTAIYTGYIVKALKTGLAMATVQSVVYIFLFGILQLTYYALLVGTIGLFITIALAMYFTRNVDWYEDNVN